MPSRKRLRFEALQRQRVAIWNASLTPLARVSNLTALMCGIGSDLNRTQLWPPKLWPRNADGVSTGLGAQGETAGVDVWDQGCADAKRFESALGEIGEARMAIEADDPWLPLEGDSLRRHPDPLLALQRGHVPAIILRGFLPASELAHMTSRMRRTALDLTNDCVPYQGGVCTALNGSKRIAQPVVNWCALLQDGVNDSSHRVVNRCRLLNKTATEFGLKLYGNLQLGKRREYLFSAAYTNSLYSALSVGCEGGHRWWCAAAHANTTR